MSTMNSKLEKLALSVRRLTSDAEEWYPQDVAYVRLAELEEEDRRVGNFPYNDHSNVQTIQDFYAGKDILITGATGFLGKVLVEKFLRSLPEGGRIFLLTRGRKGLTGQQRINEMTSLPLFDLVMRENPEAVQRLVVIEGDCCSLGLGLSPTDRQTIIDHVSFVFHCAATVRFDMSLNHMIIANTRSTREVVNLCKQMKKLDAYVHVSTAFCNATKGRTTPIPEEVIRQETDWKPVVAAVEKMENNKHPEETCVMDLIFEKLAPTHHNNYTFTKALSEDVVEEEARDLPVIIVRPTVVIATYEDPFGGWVDNLYGPMSFWDGIGQGVVRTLWGNPNHNLDYLPVDACAKVLIAAGWHRGLGFRTSSDPKKVDVVNNGMGDISQSSFQILHDKMQFLFHRSTHKYILRYPRFYMTNCFLFFWLATVTSHLPVGFLVDAVLRLKGRKPFLMKIYRRIYMAMTYFLHPFCTNEYNFDIKWHWKLQARMPEADRGRFSLISLSFVMAYYHDNIEGIIKYAFREPSYPAEQSNRRIMHIVDWVQNVFLLAAGFWILHWIFTWH